MVNENTRVCSHQIENGKKTSPFDWLPFCPSGRRRRCTELFHRSSDTQIDAEPGTLDEPQLGRWWACFYGSGSSHSDVEEDFDARLQAKDAGHVCSADSQPYWPVSLWLRCLFFLHLILSTNFCSWDNQGRPPISIRLMNLVMCLIVFQNNPPSENLQSALVHS